MAKDSREDCGVLRANWTYLEGKWSMLSDNIYLRSGREMMVLSLLMNGVTEDFFCTQIR